MQVRVRELPLQQATFGVGFSANTGPRLTLEHIHRRAVRLALDREEQVRARPRPELLARRPHLLPARRPVPQPARRHRRAAEVDRRGAYLAGARASAARRRPKRIDRLYFAEVVHARVETPVETHAQRRGQRQLPLGVGATSTACCCRPAATRCRCRRRSACARSRPGGERPVRPRLRPRSPGIGRSGRGMRTRASKPARCSHATTSACRTRCCSVPAATTRCAATRYRTLGTDR